VLATITCNGWVLIIPMAAVAAWRGFLAITRDHANTAWYRRYQPARVMPGLPPRHWWDGRLG
jgi:hypothetical protein